MREKRKGKNAIADETAKPFAEAEKAFIAERQQHIDAKWPTALMIDLGASQVRLEDTLDNRKHWPNVRAKVRNPDARNELAKNKVVIVGDYVYGEQALNKANRVWLGDVEWIEKHAGMLEDKATRATYFGLLDHAIHEWLQLTGGKHKPILLGMTLPDSRDPALETAIRNHLFDNYQDLLSATEQSDAGLLFVNESISVAYGLGYIADALVLDIGHETVNMSLLHGGIGSDAKPKYSITIGGKDKTRGGKYLQKLFMPKLEEAIRAQADVKDAEALKTMLAEDRVKQYKEQGFGFVNPKTFKGNYDDVPHEHRRTVKIPHGTTWLHIDVTEAGDRVPREWLQKDIVPAIMGLMHTPGVDPEMVRRASKNTIVNGGITAMPYFAPTLEKMLQEQLPEARVTVVPDSIYSVVHGGLRQLLWQYRTPGKRNAFYKTRAQ